MDGLTSSPLLGTETCRQKARDDLEAAERIRPSSKVRFGLKMPDVYLGGRSNMINIYY